MQRYRNQILISLVLVIALLTTIHTYARSAAVNTPAAPQLTVSKTANVNSAQVGDAITYSYEVTNTGDVALTNVIAVDDKLGAVALVVLPGGTAVLPSIQLQPGQVAVGTRTITVQTGDLPGPLVNTVIVTGTPAVGAVVTASASAQVDLLMHAQNQTICVGDDIELVVGVLPAAAGTRELVVITGPAPADLFLRGVTQCFPYTGLHSMVELTNDLATEGCAAGTACNPVTRIVFAADGGYHIETLQEVQTCRTSSCP